MILVSVGTSSMDFSRLIRAVDLSLKDYELNIQIGHSIYEPVNHKWFRFISRDEMEDLISKSELIISHAGFGFLSSVIRYNKKIIIAPREFKYNEAVNDQLELAIYLNKLYPDTIKLCKDFNNIRSIVQGLLNYVVEIKYEFSSEIPKIIFDILKQNK